MFLHGWEFILSAREAGAKTSGNAVARTILQIVNFETQDPSDLEKHPAHLQGPRVLNGLGLFFLLRPPGRQKNQKSKPIRDKLRTPAA